MKIPKLASMSLEAMYSMRNTLEKAISSHLKAARKGMSALPMMSTAKPKRKTKKTGARKTSARGTGGRTAAKKTPARRAAAGKRTAKRISKR